VKKIKFVKNERTLEILEVVAKLGFILFLGVAAPNAAGSIIKLLGWVPNNKYQIERSLKNLEKRKYIRFWIKNGQGRLELTKEGKIHLASLQVKKIKLPIKINWDGMWRIITFDIPEKLKINRRRFSRALVFVGMQNLEKSVFVYPHECKEQIFKKILSRIFSRWFTGTHHSIYFNLCFQRGGCCINTKCICNI